MAFHSTGPIKQLSFTQVAFMLSQVERSMQFFRALSASRVKYENFTRSICVSLE